MILISSEFKDKDTLNETYQADKDNKSPDLKWQNFPDNTKSFAILMHDKDAPTGGAGWWHWMVFDIPASISLLPRDAGNPSGYLLPKGAKQMVNDGGVRGYMGCYPPKGDKPHEYKFTIYALDVEHLPINPEDSTSKAGFIINSHALDKASLVGYYSR